jgi:pimeloyl-ACP methyl ester carboxylesterase
VNTSGDFGHVEKIGHGPVKMILIADVGFGWEIYKDFMVSNKKRYTMYAVTLPGSGNTPPLPMPAQNTGYEKRTGLETLQTALVNLIEKEKMDKPVVAGNLIIAAWLAMNTAVNYPGKISKVIIFGAMPYATWPSPKDRSGNTPVSMQERAQNVDYYIAPRVFKPMKRETWLKNLFQPYQYTNDSTLADKLYQTSASVMIPVMARYLSEFYTTDISESFGSVKVPVLVFIPGFSDRYFSGHPNSTDKKYFWNEWGNAGSNADFKIEKVPDARLFVWVDQLAAVNDRIKTFLEN